MENLSPDQIEKVFKLCDMLGLQDFDLASSILEQMNWSVEVCYISYQRKLYKLYWKLQALIITKNNNQNYLRIILKKNNNKIKNNNNKKIMNKIINIISTKNNMLEITKKHLIKHIKI
jgi:hypothetical protein